MEADVETEVVERWERGRGEGEVGRTYRYPIRAPAKRPISTARGKDVGGRERPTPAMNLVDGLVSTSPCGLRSREGSMMWRIGLTTPPQCPPSTP